MSFLAKLCLIFLFAPRVLQYDYAEVGHLLNQWQQQYWKVLFLSVEGAGDSTQGELPQFAEALYNYTKVHIVSRAVDAFVCGADQ